LLRLRLRAVTVAKIIKLSPIVAAIAAATFSPVHAQNSGLDLGFGLWWSDSVSTIYTLTLQRRLLGPFDYGIGISHVHVPGGTDDQRLTGGELSVGLFRGRSAGPYLLAAAGLGMRHSSGNFDTQWSTGAGYEIQALSALTLGIEGRYRVEDRGSRGFWRLHPDDGRGILIQAHLILRFGTQSRAVPNSPRQPGPYAERAPATEAAPITERRAPRDVIELRHAVVSTAMDAMGTPYKWGAAGGDGFDCSGLIQYAYGQHGLILPRTSGDQARMGQRVDPSEGFLEPGDILGFADNGGGITHVGLYVGDGMFIHSSSSGVKLSSLTTPEGDGQWWRQRWVAARRLIN